MALERSSWDRAARRAWCGDYSVGWLLTACGAFLTRGTPFHLVEFGARSGLTLIGDYLPREWSLVEPNGEAAAEPARWKDSPYPVLSRLGLDARPRLLSRREDRLWLEACMGPDDAAYHARFEKAAELFLQLQKESAGPRLLRADYGEMPAVIASKLAPHPEEGLLIYNSQATDFLGDTEYQALRKELTRTLAPWGDCGFWAELEFPRGPRTGSELHELRVHRLMDSRLESKTLASMTARPREIQLLPGWDFLRPLGPVRPPRVTIEEAPKRLEPGVYKFPAS